MNDSESKVRHGLLWLGTAGAALRSLDLVSSFVVLWFLTSEQMGLASLSWAVAIIVESLNGLGIGVALVQAERVDDEEIGSLFWFAVGFGSAFTAIIVLASPLIAFAFGAKGLAPMVSVAALRLLFMSVALVPLQLLHRRLEFQRIAAVQTLAAAAAAIVKVVLAASGLGAWALVVAHSSEALFTVCTVYAFAPLWPKPRLAWSKVQRFVRFGLRAAGSSVVYQTYRNLDFVIVGRVFGVSALGAYRVAFDVAMVPAMAILDVINRTAFPIYSRIGVREQERLKRAFLWMSRALGLIAGPLTALLCFFGADILALATGSKWLAAGPLIPALCWAAFLRTQTQAIPQVFHAAGRPELALYDSILTLPCLIVSGWLLVIGLGPRLGANAVSLAWIVTYLIMLNVLRLMARYVIGLRAWEYFRNLLHPIALMALLFAVLSLVAPALRARLPALPAVVVGLAVGLGLVVAYSRLVMRLRLSELWPRGGSTPSVQSD